MSELVGKKVWITGASSGIGEALSLEFARRGATLLLSARRKSVLEAVRQRCVEPERHRILTFDLGSLDRLPDICTQATAEFGPVDILINNGGISQRSLMAETDIEVDRKIMDINFFGGVALTKGVLPGMIRRGKGQIVVISSLMGKLATPMRSAYAASKHATQGYYDCLRAEVHGQGVRVTVVCPGYVRTEIAEHALTADGSEQMQTESRNTESMDPALFARRCVRAIEAERDEVLIGGKEVWAARFRPLLPRFYNWMIRSDPPRG